MLEHLVLELLIWVQTGPQGHRTGPQGYQTGPQHC